MFQGQTLQKIVKLTLSGTPATGILYSAVTMNYWRSGDLTLTSTSILTANWLELGGGLYALTIPATVLNVLGSFYFNLSGVGFDLYEEQFQVVPTPLQMIAQNNECIITGNLVDVTGLPTLGTQQVIFRVAQLPNKIGASLLSSTRIITNPDAYGNFSVAFIQGATLIVEIPQAGISAQIVVPMQPSALLTDLLPPIP